jgi:hypothetical protein
MAESTPEAAKIETGKNETEFIAEEAKSPSTASKEDWSSVELTGAPLACALVM